MRILFIDKTAVLESSHERYEKLAKISEIRAAVLSPFRWREHMRDVVAERTAHPDYSIYLGKTFWTGSYSRGFYTTGLTEALRDFSPRIIQLLEEPWSFFAGQTVRAARRIVPEARILFYTWENIYREGTYCSKLDPIHRRIEKRVFETAVSGICATRVAADVLHLRGFKGETPVIPYGVSEDFFLSEEEVRKQADKPPRRPPRVGYVGRLLGMKGIDTLVRALSHAEFELTVLGSGEAEAPLRALAAEIGVTERIRWFRPVPPEEVVSHLSGLDILVLHSRTTPTWAEQLGRVLLEAMARGIPVIGSTSGSIPEVIGAQGLIFREGDPVDLARSIEKLTTDTMLRKEKILDGWKKARRKYSWNRFASDLVDHYKRILD